MSVSEPGEDAVAMKWIRTALLVAAAALLALPVAAQTANRVVRVAVLMPGDMTAERQGYLKEFRDELRARGWIEGGNLVLELHSAGGRADQLSQLATTVVGTRPHAIVALGGAATARAAREATRDIPIVMVAAGGDPVSAGLINSLGRPGTNVTGSVIMSPELNGKRLELVKELVPGATRVAVVWNPTLSGTEAQLPPLQAAARSLGVELSMHAVRHVDDLPGIEEAIGREASQALLILPDPAVLESHLGRTLSMAERLKLPTVYPWRSYVNAGGLAAYAPSLPDHFRRAAVSLDRIIRGESAAELPVEQPTSFEFSLNASAARKLGLSVPPSVLARVDELVE